MRLDQVLTRGYQAIGVFVDKVQGILPPFPRWKMHIVVKVRVIVWVLGSRVEQCIHPAGPSVLRLLAWYVLRSGPWAEDTSQSGFDDTGVHPKEGDVKVHYPYYVVSEEQRYVCS
jgi:hypothetical protein